jgi:hypothetical protein
METIPKQKKTIPLLESPFLHPKHETIPMHFCHVFVVTFRDIINMFIDVLRGIQGLSKAEMTFTGQFTCLNNFGINILV